MTRATLALSLLCLASVATAADPRMLAAAYEIAGRVTGSTAVTFPTNGLVSYWSMRSSGATVYDEWSTNNATATGSPTFGTNYGVKADGVLLVGTSSQYIQCGNPAVFQLTNGTVSVWVKTAAAGSGYRGLIVKQNSYNLFLNNNVLTLFDYSTSTARDTGVNLADNAWHHVAMSFVGGVAGETRIYVDGVQRMATSWARVNDNSQISLGSNLGAQYISASVDEAAIYSAILSSNLIANIYNGGAGRFYP